MSDPGTPITPITPIVISRDDARRAAADELAKPAYAHARPSLARRVLHWIGHELHDLLDKAFGGSASGGGGGWIGVLIVLALLVAAVVIIRLRYGPVRRAVKTEHALFDEAAALDAAGYRQQAERFAASGEWAEAVRARLRAVIAGLEERGVLEPRPGRTADVAAREAGRVLAEQAEALAEAARVFDDIWYGEAEAGAEDYRRLVAVDEAVSAARIGRGVLAGAGHAGHAGGGFGGASDALEPNGADGLGGGASDARGSSSIRDPRQPDDQSSSEPR